MVFHENQFGFTRNRVCGRTLFGFRNVIKYFRKKNCNVYICSLDFLKAFDDIKHVVLLENMRDKGISSCLTTVFARWLTICLGKYKGIIIFPLSLLYDLASLKVVYWGGENFFKSYDGYNIARITTA